MLMEKSPLNEFIEYKYTAMNAMKNSQLIIALLANDSDIDMDSDEAYGIQDNNFYDYSFSDTTFQTDKAIVFCECAMRNISQQIKGMKLFVQVVCNKRFAKLNGREFGFKGNRRDNLAKAISDTLEGAVGFGIGKLNLTSCEPCSAPDGFTGITLEFEDVDFMRMSNGTR